ncbi:MAG: lipid-A-disaccharide synthase [bacterium]
MKRVFIVTGEHSGDTHAASVVEELRKINPEVEIEAIGGSNLERQGVKLFGTHSKMGVVGLDALKAIFSHIQLGKDILNYLKNEFKPDLVLLIDYGGFNLRLAEFLKKEGFPVYYYIAPQVWASRKGRIKKIKKYIDKVMVIFPFEEDFHKNEGVNAEYVGHPLLSQLPKATSKKKFSKNNFIDENKKLVGIFPGSRKMELEYLLPIFIKSANLIYEKSDKEIEFFICRASNFSKERFQTFLDNALKQVKNNKITFRVTNENNALLSSCDVSILASGTITLEAALYKTPMVVSYKGPTIAYLIYLMVKSLKYVSLPNIISGEKVVEELLQFKAQPKLISEEVIGLLYDKDKRTTMLNKLSNIREKFGDKVAAEEVARIINYKISE